MKKILFLDLIIAAAVILIAAGSAIKPAEETEAEKINWMTWEEVQEAMKEEPRKVFVDVYTNWCGWCKKMDATTFKDPKIIRYLSENYYSIKFNAEVKESIVFKGKEYKYIASGRRGYNELAAYLLNGRLSYPTTVYLDEELNVLTAVPGFKRTNDLNKILNFFGGDYFKTMDWATFAAQSPEQKKQ